MPDRSLRQPATLAVPKHPTTALDPVSPAAEKRGGSDRDTFCGGTRRGTDWGVTMGKRDPREVLGVRPDASEDDLRQAYRRLATRYHPDRNGGDKAAEAKFKEVNEAYAILKKAGRRAAYDRLDHFAFERGAASGDGGFPGGFRFVHIGELGPLGDAGGGRGAGPRSRAGIAPEEALDRAKRTVCTPSSVAREAGGGETGAEPGRPPPAQTCPAREGTGRVQRERTPSVGAPTGAEDGTRIRLAGEGEAGLHGAAADGPDVGASVGGQRRFQRDVGDTFVHVPLRATEAGLDVPLEILVPSGAGARAPTPGDGRSRLRSKHLLALLILLIGGPLLYTRMPASGPGFAAHAPGPITASVLPGPVFPEAAEEAPIGAAAAPTAAPGSGTTPGPELSAAAPAADAPAGPSAGPGPPSAVVEARPSAVASSPAPPAGAGTEPALFAILLRTGDAAMLHGDVTGARPRYGVPQDLAQSMVWYRKAAEQGNSVAQIALANMYYRGDGAPQDHAQAAAWYRKAAEQGHAAAEAALGVMYANGRGVPHDRAEALRWLRPAAAAGNGIARTELARVEAEQALEAGQPPSSPAPLAAEPTASARETPGTVDASASPAAPVADPSRLAAAAAGRTAVPETTAPRQDPNLLAALVRRGDAMFAAGDVSAARLFYERAAIGGSAAGATGVGKTHDPAFLSRINAFGIRFDPSAAATWYRQAVTLGDPEAERLLRRLGAAVAD